MMKSPRQSGLKFLAVGEKVKNMNWVFAPATVDSIAPWMAFIRAMQEQLPMDAGVEPTGMYLRRVAGVNAQFMFAP